MLEGGARSQSAAADARARWPNARRRTAERRAASRTAAADEAIRPVAGTVGPETTHSRRCCAEYIHSRLNSSFP